MNDLLRQNTPVEHHGERVWVKREDLCSPLPGPEFAKIRGVVSHIRSRPEATIGVLDTFHSKAGWAVAYVCRALGKRCLDFYPRYAADAPNTLREQQRRAADLGATLMPLAAGRSAILYHTAKKRTAEAGGYMMPNALKLWETVAEVAAEAERTPDLHRYRHLVVSASSGTITAGVLQGLANVGAFPELWIHMGYSRSQSELRAYMASKAPALTYWPTPVHLIDEGYEYKDVARGATSAPFPCNPYYDLKAWAWLLGRGLAEMPAGDVLFWNIGS